MLFGVLGESRGNAVTLTALSRSQPNHPTLGDVNKLITQEFVQQGYLTYKRLPDTDPQKYELRWGSRAYAMTSKEDVLSFVCQVRL